MKCMFLGTCLSFVLMTFSYPLSAEPEMALIKKCQKVQHQIDKLTNLKRSGGDSAEMNRWHKKRNKYKKRYADYDCKRVRHLLR